MHEFWQKLFKISADTCNVIRFKSETCMAYFFNMILSTKSKTYLQILLLHVCKKIIKAPANLQVLKLLFLALPFTRDKLFILFI
jgi:hypothetical protein